MLALKHTAPSHSGQQEITDVAGATVGHVTLISGDGPVQVGQGPLRTGVTANPGAALRVGKKQAAFLPNDSLSPLFLTTFEATEEAIVNASVAGRDMTGVNGNTVFGIPHDRLQGLIKQYNRR